MTKKLLACMFAFLLLTIFAVSVYGEDSVDFFIDNDGVLLAPIYFHFDLEDGMVIGRVPALNRQWRIEEIAGVYSVVFESADKKQSEIVRCELPETIPGAKLAISMNDWLSFDVIYTSLNESTTQSLIVKNNDGSSLVALKDINSVIKKGAAVLVVYPDDASVDPSSNPTESTADSPTIPPIQIIVPERPLYFLGTVGLIILAAIGFAIWVVYKKQAKEKNNQQQSQQTQQYGRIQGTESTRVVIQKKLPHRHHERNENQPPITAKRNSPMTEKGQSEPLIESAREDVLQMFDDYGVPKHERENLLPIFLAAYQDPYGKGIQGFMKLKDSGRAVPVSIPNYNEIIAKRVTAARFEYNDCIAPYVVVDDCELYFNAEFSVMPYTMGEDARLLEYCFKFDNNPDDRATIVLRRPAIVELVRDENHKWYRLKEQGLIGFK
jgi:hypothetical protein